MATYITAFIFYTLAMIGIMLSGFIIYKKTFVSVKSGSRGLIKVLDSTTIAPKKNLLVVKVKNEKFLIASGAEHTTFLAKLEDNNIELDLNKINQKTQMFNENLPLAPIPQNPYNPAAFENSQETKINNIQQQFRELYSQDNPRQFSQNEILNRKVRVKQLLRDLNQTTKQGAFNG